MVVIAFLSTSVAMFLIGWLVGAWCGNWKDARFLAVEAFKVAGYDPSKYNFDVKAKTDDGFRVVVTVKDGK